MKRVTREWVKKAEQDYAGALREARAKAHDLACFLAQQCIEKYLKAILEESSLAFPRTHDLRHLCNLASPVAPSLKPLLRPLRSLSDYAVQFRYPGAWATAPQSRKATLILRRARKILRSCIGP